MENEIKVKLNKDGTERKQRVQKEHCVGKTKYQQLMITSPNYYKDYYDAKTRKPIICHICDSVYTLNHQARHFLSKKHTDRKMKGYNELHDLIKQAFDLIVDNDDDKILD